MAVVITATKPAGVRDGVAGSAECRVRDITYDTGTYVTTGNTITAASLGLKTIDFVDFGTMVATNGTAGVTGNVMGVRYAANRQSVIFQMYESGAANAALAEKTSAEATAANFTFRVKFESWA